MGSSRSLSNLSKQTKSKMQIQSTHDKIKNFVQKKFRVSRSYSTRDGYESAINRFIEFVRIQYNLDMEQLLRMIKETKEIDPISVLDDYYTYLSNYKKSTAKTGYAGATIKYYINVTKEFLNYEGCKIYNEDVKQRFKLPRKTLVYEKGLTKETINRLIRLANPKLATTILIACSSGMRISEIVQLRLSDIDFTKNPTTITIRKETAKTRQTRVTCITSETTVALKDYLRQYLAWHENYNEDRHILLSTFEERIKRLEEKLQQNNYNVELYRGQDKKRLALLEKQLETLGEDELYARSVKTTKHSLENQLRNIVNSIPELDTKNDNGRNSIHFHAFRAWFKTQVTDAHQSDFAESLMGHTSLKLVYYRQNENARKETYLKIEPFLTIADTTKIEIKYEKLEEENLDLRKIVEGLSIQLQNLEKRIENKA